MDHTDLTVSNFMKNSTYLKRLKVVELRKQLKS